MFRYYITRKTAEGALCIPEQPTPAVTYTYGDNGSKFNHIGQVWGYVEYEEPLPLSAEEYCLVAGTIPKYHPISEDTARRAKEMMSFYEYIPGTATASYRRQVDEAYVIAEHCKNRVDPMYHEKIDYLAARYAEKLAANLNDSYRIGTMCPSVMIAGAANFPVRKKEKQIAASDRNMAEYNEIQGLLDKMRSVGKGGISSDDPNAKEKLQKKLASLEKLQQHMRDVNAWYRKNKTLDGCPHLSEREILEIKADMSSTFHLEDKPYASYLLSNNNANIRRIKERIAELEKRETAQAPTGWEFEDGEVVMNTEENRLQIFYEGKPDDDTRTNLKSHGFRWSPKNGCWQRQLTDNAVWAAKKIAPPAE